MQPATIPEIQRQNLASTILSLKARGINDLLNFGFLDPPPEKTMLSALEELYHLEALDDEGLLTRLGRAMVDFPMDPALAKTCICSAREWRCSDEVLTIVSCISSGQEFFSRPRAEQNKADQKKAKFHDATGDHLTLLNVFEAWQKNGGEYHKSNTLCSEEAILTNIFRVIRLVQGQLYPVQVFETCERRTRAISLHHATSPDADHSLEPGYSPYKEVIGRGFIQEHCTQRSTRRIQDIDRAAAGGVASQQRSVWQDGRLRGVSQLGRDGQGVHALLQYHRCQVAPGAGTKLLQSGGSDAAEQAAEGAEDSTTCWQRRR